jgi:hypothetical protein
MKRSPHRLTTIGIMSILGAAFAADMPLATAASIDAVHQSVLEQREFGQVVRPPAGIPTSSGHPHAIATPAMRATDQHVREFLEWKDRHAPSSSRVGGSLR